MPTFNYNWIPAATGSGDLLPFLFALYGLLWLLSLGLALTRGDLDPVSRLTWVLVIILVPLAGLILYFVLAPRRLAESQARTFHQQGQTAGTPWEDVPGHEHPRGT